MFQGHMIKICIKLPNSCYIARPVPAVCHQLPELADHDGHERGHQATQQHLLPQEVSHGFTIFLLAPSPIAYQQGQGTNRHLR